MEAVIEKLREDAHSLRERVSLTESKVEDLEDDTKEHALRIWKLELGQAKLMVIYGAITILGSSLGAGIVKLIFN